MALPHSAAAQSPDPRTAPLSARQSWGLARTDCDPAPAQFQMSSQKHAEAAQPVTKVSFQCGTGSEVLVAWPIPPAWMISEFEAEVDVLPDRPNPRLMVRVVLPEVSDPAGDGPLTVWLEGPAAASFGRWNHLQLSRAPVDLATQLKRQIWFLRSRLGPSVSDRGAFIDAIGFNLYSGPGQHSVLLSQPRISGAVAADPAVTAAPPRMNRIEDSAVRRTSLRVPERARGQDPARSVAVRNGTVIELAGQPFFARVIQHNGEPFALLRDLGFNTVQLAATATDQQLASANEAGVWLVCPPPPSMGLVPVDGRFDRVIAWSLGNHRTAPDLLLGQQMADQIRLHDGGRNRLLFAEVSGGYQEWGQLLDIMQLGAAPLVTGTPPTHHGDWTGFARQASGDRIPVWSDVPSELPSELVRQVMAMAGQVPPLPVDLQSMESMAFHALAGGARGIRVLSRSRLDAADPQTRLRAMSLRRLNQRLTVAEPWAAGGIILGTLDSPGGLRTAALKTSRGQLLIASRSSDPGLPLPGDAAIQSIRIPDRWSSVSDQAWQVTDEGLVPLAGQYSVNGTEIQVDHAPWMTLVVVTQDPSLVQSLNAGWQGTDLRNTIEIRRELTTQWLAVLQLVTGQLNGTGRDFPLVNQAIGEALTQIQNAEVAVGSPTPALASPALDLADQRLASARQLLLRAAREPFSPHDSSPLLAHTALLPLHWHLATQLAGKAWDPNGLSGGDFENLQHMIDSGWTMERSDDTELATEVALSPLQPVRGTYSLHLSASHRSPHSGLAESPPLQIQSAPVFVRGNKLVRIHGWARIPAALNNQGMGLLVHDSLGGPGLGVSCRAGNVWQEFTLYRSSGQDAELRIRIVLDGYGEAFLDELTVETIELPAAEIRSARLSPENGSAPDK